MKSNRTLVGRAASLVGALAAGAVLAQVPPVHYHLADPLAPGGPGRWDYILADAPDHLLYVPRTTHTQVIDEQSGKVIADIDGQKSNHGVALAPKAGRGYITDGEGAIHVFDIKTNTVLGRIKAPEDADGIIYDDASDKVLAVCGDAGVLLVIDPSVDPKTGQPEATLELGGKPEFLTADGKGKAYINLKDKDQVAVADIAAGKVIGHWAVAPGGAPVGMSMDRANRRLFIGCRNPAKMIVMNADDGKIIADLPIGKGCDATAFDAGYAFASCVDGTITVIGETGGKLAVVDTINTPVGARTMTVDSITHALYLPTADFEPKQPGEKWPHPKEGTFRIVVVKPSRSVRCNTRG